MKVPVSWLRDYVPIEMPIPELRGPARHLRPARSTGSRLSGVADVDGNLGLFRVGRVLDAVKHPNADRLQLCQVDVGEGNPRQIVCGAWNFGAGATVGVALPGAVLPNGLQLEQRKVARRAQRRDDSRRGRGRARRDHTGIMVLPERDRAGNAARGRASAHGHVLALETSHNRPDLLAVYGIAREVAALFDLRARRRRREPTRRGAATSRSTSPSRTSKAARATSAASSETRRSDPRRCGCKARLLAAGMRPISNVVDVTNYVMLALGNPLHAFDYSKLAGGKIVVRRAQAGREAAHARRRRP